MQAAPVPKPGAMSSLDFRAIYDAHFSHVWRTLRRFGVPQRDLEDAVHDVFLVMHRRLADFDRSRPVRPWLTGIAWRVAADVRRKACHRREELGKELDGICCLPRPDELLAADQARALVHRALETLDLDRRVIFVMHELDGVACPQIAEAIELPLNTVYSRLRIARKRFAASIRRFKLGGSQR